MRKNWTIAYEDYLFDGVVPLYKRTGTSLFNTTFKIGDPVYLPGQNSIGFVINGPVDQKEWEDWRGELKTDVDGNQCDIVRLRPEYLLIPGVHNPYLEYEDVITFFKNL